MRLLLASIVILSAGTSVITLAAASEFFPLGEGWEWSYIGDGGDAQTAHMDGFREVQGKQTRVRQMQYSGEINEVLENYFTSDDDGNVFIHGFDLNNGELIRSYEPPILMVPSALSVGDQWCTTTQGYGDLEGNIPSGDPIEICFEVYSLDELNLPAGTFSAFGVGQFAPGGAALDHTQHTGAEALFAGRDALGRVIGTDRGNARDWYASGVGRVAERIYQYFELASYTQPPTPIQETSWGQIKREFGTITKSN